MPQYAMARNPNQPLAQAMNPQAFGKGASTELPINIQALLPLLSILGGIGSSVQTQQATNQANYENDARYGQGLKLLEDLRNNIPGRISNLGNAVLGQMGLASQGSSNEWNSLINSSNQTNADLSGWLANEYNQRTARNLGYIENAGTQRKADINRQFDQQRFQQGADLTSRGFGGTSVLPSLQAGTERQRSDSLNALQESINQQKVGVDMQGSGDALSAYERMKNFGLSNFMGMKQAQINMDNANSWALLNNAYTMGRAPIDYESSAVNQMVNWIGNRYDVAPNPGQNLQLLSNLGSSFAPPPSYPQQSQSGALIGGLGGAGIGVGGTVLGIKMVTVAACVDSNSRITMANGTTKALKAIRKGDIILGASGKRRVVLGIDLGAQTVRGLHVQIEFNNGNSLIISRDHILGGVPAGQWDVGARFEGGPEIVAIRAVQPEQTGDLLLEEGDGYYANNIPVASMLAFRGISSDELDNFHSLMGV